MSKFQMDHGTVIDTKNATASYDEDTYWDGHNHCSVATGSQWVHETLYRSRKGRWYIEHSSQWQGSKDHAEWVSREEAARWLLASNHDLPDELAGLEDSIIE